MALTLPARFAVIADTHGNADALAAAETAGMLLARPMLSIRGNHDRALVEGDPEHMGLSDRAAYAQLSPRHLDWLRALPAVLKLPEPLACHGAPGDDLSMLLEEVTPGGLVRLRPGAEIEARLSGVSEVLILCGHTHFARRVRLSDGRFVVNPGSVGCPAFRDDQPISHVMETGSPAASYAVIERGSQGWLSEIRQILHDNRRMVRMAQEAGRTDWAEALATGRIA